MKKQTARLQVDPNCTFRQKLSVGVGYLAKSDGTVFYVSDGTKVVSPHTMDGEVVTYRIYKRRDVRGYLRDYCHVTRNDEVTYTPDTILRITATGDVYANSL